MRDRSPPYRYCRRVAQASLMADCHQYFESRCTDRSDAYPANEIARLQRTQVSPPFDLLHQQGLGPRSGLRARPEDFQTFNKWTILNCPVVLSVDPGQSGSSNASRSVIQAWKFHDKNYFLIDQFCESVDAEDLRHAFWKSVKRNNPSVALIEKTANGWPLYAAVQRKARFHCNSSRQGEFLRQSA